MKHLDKIAALGCLICGRPAEIHHVRMGVGMGQRGKEVIPLCEKHHRLGPFGECAHNGAKTFAKKYGTELEMVEKVNLLIGTDNADK